MTERPKSPQESAGAREPIVFVSTTTNRCAGRLATSFNRWD